jgi:hypothetical protein
MFRMILLVTFSDIFFKKKKNQKKPKYQKTKKEFRTKLLQLHQSAISLHKVYALRYYFLYLFCCVIFETINQE